MLHQWRTSLSGEAKAAIIAAIVGPIVSEILGIRVRMIDNFYWRALEKMAKAKAELRKESERKNPQIINVNEAPNPYEDDPFYPIEILAKKAGISLWRARRAIRWRDKQKFFKTVVG